jgi:hypothetical protein
MEDNSTPAKTGDTASPKKSLTDLDGAEDGRNKEWAERARVNLEEVPEDTRTNIERDFEPDHPDTKGKKQNNNEVY